MILDNLFQFLEVEQTSKIAIAQTLKFTQIGDVVLEVELFCDCGKALVAASHFPGQKSAMKSGDKWQNFPRAQNPPHSPAAKSDAFANVQIHQLKQISYF